MVSKMWSFAFMLLLMMLFSGVVSGGNLLLGGINQDMPVCAEPCSSAANSNYKEIAADLDAYYFPMYNDADPLDNIGEVQSAATGEATDQNGLTNAALHGTENDPKEYDTILAYSGGTATALTALSNYDEFRVTCDTLILVSPMSAGVSDEIFAKIRKTYEEDCGGTACWKLLGNALDIKTANDQIKARYRAQIRAILESDPPVVNNIVVITSPQDELMPFVSDIFQVRDFEQYTWETEWERTVDINPAISITNQVVPLTEFEENGDEAHRQLFFEYARTHLSNTDGGVIEFNPEGNPVKEPNQGTAPTVQAFEVTPLDLNVGGSFEIDYTVSDSSGSGLKQVELWRKDEQSDWQEIKRDEISGDDGPISGSFTDSPSAPGKYWYGVHVVDNAGNSNDERNINTANQPGDWGPAEVEVKTTQESVSCALIRTLEGHSSEVQSIAFSPDGRILASGGSNSTAPDGNRSKLTLWDVETGEEIRTLDGHSQGVSSVAFSPDGRIFASGDTVGTYASGVWWGYESTVTLWDVETGEEIRTLDCHSQDVSSVAFSPDGRTLASGGDEVKLWDTSSGEEIWTNDSYCYVNGIAFSPDGRILASGERCNRVTLWDADTGEVISTQHKRSEGSMFSVAFSPDGRILASGGYGGLTLWDSKTGEEISSLTEDFYPVTDVAFSPDGRMIGAAKDSNNGCYLALWDAETAEEIWSSERDQNTWVQWYYDVAFSPDGRTIASGDSNGAVKLWVVA
jgi:WD40 repeat protein